ARMAAQREIESERRAALGRGMRGRPPAAAVDDEQAARVVAGNAERGAGIVDAESRAVVAAGPRALKREEREECAFAFGEAAGAGALLRGSRSRRVLTVRVPGRPASRLRRRARFGPAYGRQRARSGPAMCGPSGRRLVPRWAAQRRRSAP